MAMDLINMCLSIRPEKHLIERITITNSNPIFGMIYKTVQGKLDPSIRRVLRIEANSKFE